MCADEDNGQISVQEGAWNGKKEECEEHGAGFEAEGAGQGMIFLAKRKNTGSFLGERVVVGMAAQTVRCKSTFRMTWRVWKSPGPGSKRLKEQRD